MLIIDQLRRQDPRLRVLAIVFLAGLGLLASGLWYVQLFTGKRYQQTQVSQSFRTVRLPALRGKIFDANGTPLAENHPSYTINLYLEELRPWFQAEFSAALEARSRLPGNEGRPRLNRVQREELGKHTRYRVVSNLVLTVSTALKQPMHLDARLFLTHYDQRLFLPMPMLKDLSPSQIGVFVEQMGALPGLDLEVNPIRAYPHQSTAAHLLGYLLRDDAPADEERFYNYRMPDYRGVSGLEGAFDARLRGNTGMKSVLVNSLGYRQSENIWASAEAGRNVHLTLDLAIQQSAERALRSGFNGTNTQGAIVVMDTRNGDLLAVASSPTFDPNQFVPRMSREVWSYLQDEQLRPLINRATYGIYHPGSIFKLIVGLAGLEAGTLDPAEVYDSPGYFELGRGHRIRDTAGPGQFNFRRATLKSSNPYFIHEGLEAGVDSILKLGERLHLGERCDIPTLQDAAGIFPTRAWQQQNLGGVWYDGDTANLCIGQGRISVTPLQVAVMVAAIANGGNVLWPRLVSRVESQDAFRPEDTEEFPAPRVRDQLGVSRRSLDIVREAMLADVEDGEGTGRRAYVPGMRICGKTGTAEKQLGRRIIGQTTWFASFAPYENPRYAVVVMVDDGVSGGETCAPLARQVYLALQKREQTRVEPPGPVVSAY